MTAFGKDALSSASSSTRRFGRLQLLRLLGRSERTMAWQATDPRGGHTLMLMLPRQQPHDPAALERWRQALHQASRLDHPELARAVEIGVQDGWPYAAYDFDGATTLADSAVAAGLPGVEAATLALRLLGGLAFAHEAGVAHHDLQPWAVLQRGDGALQLAGLGVASTMLAASLNAAAAAAAVPPTDLRAQRDAAERDVLAAGLLLHGWLAGAPALDEPDSGRVIARLPPLGREIVRLPWTTRHLVPEPLRAIVNRATDRQKRQRYLNARSLQRALQGWLQTEAGQDGGPLALLSDRLRSAGVLPASPNAATRAARLALMDRQRTNELADLVLQDLALSFEMLRLVNSAQVRGAQLAGSGPMLTVRRAIAMLGVEGVRRSALALRPWPGPLDEGGAAALDALMARCRRAGRVALALRPAAYDAEVVYVLTLLQSLGRLVVQYHFADEAQQIRRLMQPAVATPGRDTEDPGMGEEQAAFAVLGTDIEAIGLAVARSWGLDDGVLTILRRYSATAPVRSAESDDDMLRTVASCANEAVDADAPGALSPGAALQRVAQRYGRVLGVGVRELQAALQGADRPAQAEPTTSVA